MEIVKKKIEELKTNEYNPNVMSKNKFKSLKESIKLFGFVLPILIDTNNIIIDGEHRWRACKQLDIPEIDCVIYSGKADIDKYRELITISMNNIRGENEENKFIDVLNDIVSKINYKDIIAFSGYEKNYLDEIISDNNMDALKTDIDDDSDTVPDKAEKITKKGDLWELGRHKLLCGDCTIKENIKILMVDDKAQLLFTSPPYTDMRTYEKGQDLSTDNLIKFIKNFSSYVDFQIINLGIKRENNEIVEYWNRYIEEFKNNGYKFSSWNIWDRGIAKTLGQKTAMFGIEHEWIFVFCRTKKEIKETVINKNAGNKDSGGQREKDGEMGERNHYVEKEHRRLGTIQRINVENVNITNHPAVFPVKLPQEYIDAMTDKDDIVIDCFIGSGSSLIACEKTGRVCYGMEIDPQYCDIIVQRYKDYCINNQILPSIKLNGKKFNIEITKGE